VNSIIILSPEALICFRAARLARSTMLSIFLRCWLVYICGSKRRRWDFLARAKAPKPSERLLHGAYRHVLIESALSV